jgi:phenylalanyl-tRNA synthetase beta subunit
MSLVGLAREISANSAKPTQLVESTTMKVSYVEQSKVKISDEAECAHFVSVKLRVDNSSKSPQWLVDNLEGNGLRSINPVVDISNFVMLEYGQPSHSYDAAKLNGNLSVRRAKKTESLPCLDGKTRQLTSEDLVIADNTQVVGLAGVIGGIATETNPNTKEIVLEVAVFDKTLVRRSAQRHGARTEASARFERGLPLPLQTLALERLLHLLREICKAEVIEGPFDQLYDWPWVQYVGLRVKTAEKLLGMDLDEKVIIDGLRKRGFIAEHFSLNAEAKKHIHKPYKYGARFRVDGEQAFDCSYLTERIYSKVGVMIGHTAAQQFESGMVVDEASLKPGDLMFVKDKMSDNKLAKARRGISHVGMYLGGSKVLEAKQSVGKVRVTSLSEFLKRKGYIGSRRYIESFNHIIAVEVPWWRADVRLEEDLVEEAAKIVGYEKMPETLSLLPPTQTSDHQQLIRLLELKKQLAAIGAQEVVTYSFVSQEDLKLVGGDVSKALEVVNPLQKEQALIRTEVLPSHLQVVRNNQSDLEQSVFFEITKLQIWGKKPTKIDERWYLAVTASGDQSYVQAKAVVDKLQSFWGNDFSLKRSELGMMAKGRQAELSVGGKSIGSIGQIYPSILTKFGIKREVSHALACLSSMLTTTVEKQIRSLPSYPLIVRSLTIECQQDCMWQSINDSLQKQPFVVATEYIGEYQDQKLADQSSKRISLTMYLDLGDKVEQTTIDKTMSQAITALQKLAGLADLKIC